MNINRRIATSAAFLVLLSTLSATPSAFAAVCSSSVVIGPYGTVTSVEAENCVSIGADFVQFGVQPRLGDDTYDLPSLFSIVDSPRSKRLPFNNLLASLLGNTILGLGDAPRTLVTNKTITPRKGKSSIVVAVPGNPIQVSVNGFERTGTKVEFMLEVTGVIGKNTVGFSEPSSTGQITLPVVTLETGESATFTLVEWRTNSRGVIDYTAGKISTEIVSIKGIGVSSTSTNQLRAR